MYMQPIQNIKPFADVMGEGFTGIQGILQKAREASMERAKQRQLMDYNNQMMDFRRMQHTENLDQKREAAAASHAMDSVKTDLLRARIEYLKKGGANQYKETPEQKTERALQTNEGKLRQKEQFETNKAIEGQSENLMKNFNHLERIADILKQNKGKTGRYESFKSNFLSNPTISALNAHTKPLQGEIARDLGAQGGFKVAKLAEEAKPAANKSFEENKASVNELAKIGLNNYNLLKKHYEESNPGKKYPHKLPDWIEKGLFEEQPRAKVYNGKTYHFINGKWHE